ncbi:MAG: hypothetical protein GVY02_06065 [Bacteroidetes bacterium]|jgi:hypothetical protein|nr:hypothetical protein [Bacteroidota bacterium]
MKTLFFITIFTSFSIFAGADIFHDSNKHLIEIKIEACPANHKQAKKELKEYLARERTVEDLSRNYNMNIDSSAQDKIYALETEKDFDECGKLIENLNLSEDERSHSFYKVAEHYFIVSYLISDKGVFEYKSTTIVNREFEAIAVVLNIEY